MREGSALGQLRAATASDHEAVDHAFSRFDLADRDDYVAFLEAHARVVPPVEAMLAGVTGPPPLRPRTPLLAADLRMLGRRAPAPVLVHAPRSSAEAWGVAYVIEGSRLGGGLLAKRVDPRLPCSYLADAHQPGEWRTFMQALDEALVGDADMAAATEAARRIFAAYAHAAQES